MFDLQLVGCSERMTRRVNLSLVDLAVLTITINVPSVACVVWLAQPVTVLYIYSFRQLETNDEGRLDR